MSRERRFAKNTMILAIGTFLPKLSTFITLPILTGCLTKAEYGTYDLIMVLVSLLLPTVTFQIQAAAFRILIDVRDNENEIKIVVTDIFAFITPVSLIALAILYCCLYNQSPLVRLFICLYFLVDIFVNSARQICRGLSHNMDFTISAILSALGKVIFTVVCVYLLRIGLLGTVIALFGASTFSFLYLVIKLKLYRYVEWHSFSFDKLKEMLAYSWPLVPNSMSSWIMRVSDRFVVTMFMGVAANAVYAVASKLPALLNLAQTTFTMAWQEHASVVSKDEDASEYYSHMFKVLFDLMAGFFCFLIALTPILFNLLVRGDYEEAYPQIPILFLGIFFYSLTTFFGGIYVAHKKTRSIGITTFWAALCNLVIDVGTIKLIGLYAASGSTLVSFVFLFIYRIIDVQKYVRIHYSLKHILGILTIMVAECVLCIQRMIVFDATNICVGLTVFLFLNRDFIKTIFKKLLSSRWKKQI